MNEWKRALGGVVCGLSLAISAALFLAAALQLRERWRELDEIYELFLAVGGLGEES